MSERLFPSLKDTVENNDVTHIENCFCVNCGKNGTTRLLLTEIPFFREVVVMSFDCPHCNYQNNELQPAQQIAEKGVRFELNVDDVKDLTRQLVKTEWANVKIPEIDFEVKQQNGLVTTVEGILERAITGLQYSCEQNSTNQEELRAFIQKMIALKEGKEKFTLIVEDISGNSFVENFLAPEPDPKLHITNFIRTIEEDKLLGIYNESADEGKYNKSLKDEVLQFQTNCPDCNAPCFTNMKLTSIPHFKDVIIMATNCDACGSRTNEIKPGAGIEPKGARITLKIKNDEDLKKDVVRSDTCNIIIPELKLTLNSSGSGRYTTIEGLGLNIINDLQGTNPFLDGDSSREEIREKLKSLKEKLSNMINLTIILDDPCGNSFVKDADQIEHYDRTWEQNEELGLNDIDVEL